MFYTSTNQDQLSPDCRRRRMLVDTIEIKIIKVHRLPQDSSVRIKAFVDIAINDVLLIKGIRVVQGKKGLFVSMPSEQGKNERWYERVRCLNQDMRSMIAEKVLEAYGA